ncbi:hypothetical protein ACMDCR_27665 [Labrys okinawensis]|uniref:hypothetical protein n=1 Tax=Labrys okinawensis TaxID=346911 RepID=UPI0039BCDDF2
MEGEFDRKRRRVKKMRLNWAKCLVKPVTVRMAVAVIVGITKVIAALYKLYCEFRH